MFFRIQFGSKGELRGQLFDQAEPNVTRVLEVLLDGQICASAVCDQPGANDARIGFDFTLPLGQMTFAPAASLSFRDRSTGDMLDQPRPVPESWRALQLKDTSITGHLEDASDEGRINGWVWAPGAPQERLQVTILVNDVPCVTTVASLERRDLKASGIGDGKHAFECVLPWESLSSHRQLRITARATPNLIPFGKSLLLRREQGTALEQRLLQAEAELKRVRAEQQQLQQQLRQAGAAATAELFQTVGQFFTQLAEGAGKGEMPVLATRRGATLAELRSRFPRLTLSPPPANPEALIVIPAMGAIESVVGCIESLIRTGADRRSEILLFDPGTSEEMPFLPALLRHARYMRLFPGEDSARLRNDALLMGSPSAVILLAPGARVEGGWFDLLLAALHQAPDIAAAGAGLVREDGQYHHTGLLLGGGAGRMIDIGAGQPLTAGLARVRRPCDALGLGCVALNRTLLGKLGGFDATIEDWGAALLNFSLAARNAQLRLVTEPAALVRWLELPDQPVWIRRNLGAPAQPMPQLRARWRQLIQSADAEKRGLDRFYRAHVVAAGQGVPVNDLSAIGCRVSVLDAGVPSEDWRRRGIEQIDERTAADPQIFWVSDPEALAAGRTRYRRARIFYGPDWKGSVEWREGDLVWARDENEREALLKSGVPEAAAVLLNREGLEAATN